MECNFVVGQRVVFIGEGNFPLWPAHYERPLYGHVYTIQSIGRDPYYPELIGIYLKELLHPPVPDHPMRLNWACDVKEWRPAVDRKTDISIFQKMLTHCKETV